jgi:hypothetical protein
MKRGQIASGMSWFVFTIVLVAMMVVFSALFVLGGIKGGNFFKSAVIDSSPYTSQGRLAMQRGLVFVFRSVQGDVCGGNEVGSYFYDSLGELCSEVCGDLEEASDSNPIFEGRQELLDCFISSHDKFCSGGDWIFLTLFGRADILSDSDMPREWSEDAGVFDDGLSGGELIFPFRDGLISEIKFREDGKC